LKIRCNIAVARLTWEKRRKNIIFFEKCFLTFSVSRDQNAHGIPLLKARIGKHKYRKAAARDI